MYFPVHIGALKQTFSIFWTFTGHLAALNQNFEHDFLFGATKSGVQLASGSTG